MKKTWINTGTTNGFIAELHDCFYFYTKQSEDNEYKWGRYFVGPSLFYRRLNVMSQNYYSSSDYTFNTFASTIMIGYNLTFH